MDISEEVSLCAALVVVVVGTIMLKRRKKRQKRRWQVRPCNRERNLKSQFCYFKKIKERDRETFFSYTRMNVETFNNLLNLVSHQLMIKHSRALSPEMKLALTLNYLSQGGTMQNVAWSYHIGKTTASKVIHEVFTVLWEVLSHIYLRPLRKEEWLAISEDFWDMWNFPLCLGAVDGKHIQIQAPHNSGSEYFCHKKFHSLVLMAACDAKYNFTFVDVGAYGSESDSSVLGMSGFGRALLDSRIQVIDAPQEGYLPNTQEKSNYCFIADEAFPLKSHIMRPYPGRNLNDECHIFNYRLSRARRAIGSAFGILVARWRIFRQVIVASPANAECIVLATLCLHNYIKVHETNMGRYCPTQFGDTVDKDGNVVPGQFRNEDTSSCLESHRWGSNNMARVAAQQWETLKEYFLSSEGSVDWQYAHISRGRVPFGVIFK